MLLTLVKIVDVYFASIPRKKPQVQSIQDVKLIAHRGAHNNKQGIIENTHAAFQLARDVGCWGIEFDIHATADKVMVVNHDPTLNRLWGHNVAIADLTFTALRALEPGIPSLSEVIAEYSRDMHLFIELKTPFTDEEALFRELKSLTACKDYHLLTLHAPVFTHLTQFPKQSLVFVALHNNVQEFCDLSIKENYGGVTGSYVLFTNQRLHQLKEANQVCGVGFVDSKNSLYRELNRGIKWIFTNQAVQVSHYLQELKCLQTYFDN